MVNSNFKSVQGLSTKHLGAWSRIREAATSVTTATVTAKVETYSATMELPGIVTQAGMLRKPNCSCPAPGRRRPIANATGLRFRENQGAGGISPQGLKCLREKTTR